MPAKLPAIVAVDANFLVLVLAPRRKTDEEHKAWHLLERLEKARGKLFIPMPALAEYLVRAEAASLPLLEHLEKKVFVEPADFDRAAAFECAQMDAAALGRGDKKDGARESWQKVKIDRQIVAIAKARGAGLIVTTDSNVRNNASRIGMSAMSPSELSFPPDLVQGRLPLKKGGT